MQPGQHLDVRGERVLIMEHEPDPPDRCEALSFVEHGSQSDPRGFFHRVSEGTGGQGREGNGAEMVRFSELECFTVA